MRRGASISALVLLPFMAACAGGPGGGSSGPAVLAYTAGGTMMYSQVDSAVISIDAGGQMIDVNASTDQVMEMVFAPSADGVQVTATWRELDAVVSNPMGAPERADIDDVEGSLVFTLDRMGAATMVSAPELSGSAVQMVSPAGIANGFLPRLPGTPPEAGMTWTDTISYSADEGDASTVAETVYTYTVVGDTVVNGMNLLKVDMRGVDDRTIEGATAGMGFVQTVSGDITGFFLWDLAAGMMHSTFVETEMFGTMDVDMAPFPLDVSMRGKTRVVPAGN